MSKKYEKIVEKNKRKIKRRKPQPKTIDDYLTNLLIDLRNYDNRANAIEENIFKLKRYGWQIGHNIEEIIKILREHGIYKNVMEREKI